MSGEEAGAVLEKLAKALNTKVRWIWGQFGGTLYGSSFLKCHSSLFFSSGKDFSTSASRRLIPDGSVRILARYSSGNIPKNPEINKFVILRGIDMDAIHHISAKVGTADPGKYQKFIWIV
ncbi:hypothetical protein VE00_05847 [Pseudogymnoascus sp. WSF 3629]|nr:hypothetical protein VE00_05847 [Pseudogymnoascus sp. WSF 3629]